MELEHNIQREEIVMDLKLPLLLTLALTVTHRVKNRKKEQLFELKI